MPHARMMDDYTREGLIQRVERVASENPAQLYNQSFVNNRGKTTDTKEPYTEVVAEWCLEHMGELVRSIPTITRTRTYRTDGHDGEVGNEDSNREEELIAKALRRQRQLLVIGEVLDYQTPLKGKRSDHAGKVDLLAYDGTALRILELKKPASRETMLRCVLESLTYWKTADLQKLADDFGHTGAPVLANPLVAEGGLQQREMEEGRPELERLMRELDRRYHLDMRPLYYVKGADGMYSISF